jgi:hypothetical protein
MIKGAGSLIGAIGGVAKNWPTDPVYQGSPYVGAYSSMGLTYQPASGGMAPGYIYTNPAEVGPPISAMMVT